MDSNNPESLENCRGALEKSIGPDVILPAKLNLQPWTEEGKDVIKISNEDSNIGRKVKESLRCVLVVVKWNFFCNITPRTIKI